MNFVKFAKRKTLLLALAFMLPLAAVWWCSAASYYELYIPIPSSRGDIWSHTERSTLSRTGDSGVEYLLRREGTADSDVVGWQSAGEGLNYIDRWLVERGWERTEMYTEGDPALPESQFLKFGQTYAVYTDPEDRSGFNGNARGALGRVTVAVWPIATSSESECPASGFNVVIVTVRPSWWRVMSHAFED
jgi:hypothetical protein